MQREKQSDLLKETILLPDELACIVFDWDGTLLNSSASVIRAHKHALAELKLKAFTDRELSNFLGYDKYQVCSALTHNSSIAPSEYYRCFSNHYDVLCSQMQLFEAVRPLLTLVRNNQLKIALATNKSSHLVQLELKRTQSSHFFYHCAYADLSVAKPDPTMLLECLNTCGVHKSQSLMVGDQTADINAACAAGIPSITLIDRDIPIWAEKYREKTQFCRHDVLLKAMQQRFF